MNVSFGQPLRLSLERMARMLFGPGRVRFWFTLGFAAFLSEYLSWGLGRGSGGSRVRGEHGPDVVPTEILGKIVDFLRNPIVTAVVIWIVLCALIAWVMITWISSRGRFIFLDNVARERAQIGEPWRRYKHLGNSLFVWRLVVNALVLMIIGAMCAPFLAAIAALIHTGSFRPSDLYVLLPLPFMLLPVAIIAGYVHLFRTSFVEPIMYRDDVGVMTAWKRFMSLFMSRPLPFLLYGVYSLMLLSVAIVAVFMFGIATLGIGFILLALPYIGSVLLLPLEVLFRALGPEFLAQFGAEYAALQGPVAPVSPEAPAPTTAPTTS